MNSKHIKCLLVAVLFIAFGTNAQPTKNWDKEKIIGQRYYIPDRYTGSPYLVEGWQKGSIQFASGQEVDGLTMKYDGYSDELVYINELYQIMVKIEKPTVESFWFTNDGTDYYFERRYFDGLFKGERYFQVFHKGAVDLLCYRKIELISCSAYRDATGRLKNMEYVPSFHYYLYKKGEGYNSTNLRKKSLLKYFSGPQKKRVSQLMRANHVRFKTADGFAQALSILESNQMNIEL